MAYVDWVSQSDISENISKFRKSLLHTQKKGKQYCGMFDQNREQRSKTGHIVGLICKLKYVACFKESLKDTFADLTGIVWRHALIFVMKDFTYFV